MIPFQVVIHVLAATPSGQPPAPESFPVSFEEVAVALEALERLYFEPDGSFVWTGTEVGAGGEERWQLDGMLYDRNGQVLYAELKGAAPRAQIERLFATLGWPQVGLSFRMVQSGELLDEAAFRRHLAGKSIAGT